MVGIEAAHIFPYSLLKQRAGESRGRPDFWSILANFWTQDKIVRWQNKVFPNSGPGVEACYNLISLCRNAHGWWNEGAFALKPLKASSDGTQLTLQFFWQAPYTHQRTDKINLLTMPMSSQHLNRSGDRWLAIEKGERLEYITSGDVFTLTTEDPTNLPLPDWDLLEMQWHLQRLVGMSGAAGWLELENPDDEEDDVLDPSDWFEPLPDPAHQGEINPTTVHMSRVPALQDSAIGHLQDGASVEVH